MPVHSSHGMISSIISRNSSRFVFFFRQLYSISLRLSCFISHAPFSPILSYIPECGGLNQRFPNNISFSSFVSVGTARNQIDVGLRSYASGNNCSFDIERSSFNTLSSMKDHLDRGRLLLISVDDFGDPAVDHSIVATGYSSNSLYIQNGWSRNRIMYSYSSLDIAQYVYISPLPW